jgi:hypothetical protein
MCINNDYVNKLSTFVFQNTECNRIKYTTLNIYYDQTRIRADDQVATLWNAFVRRFSVVRRNPQGGQVGNWVMSLT